MWLFKNIAKSALHTHKKIYIYMSTYEDLYCFITIKGVSIEDICCTSIISPPLSSCVWQNFPVLHTSLPPSMETVHCGFVEMMQVRTWETGSVNNAGSCQRGRPTLSFLPSMVVISASLPMVKELVTVFPGVLEVTTKSLPFCLISVTGLMSLAILMTSSGSSG